MLKKILSTSFLILSASTLLSQQTGKQSDKANFIEYKNDFMNTIQKGLSEYNKKPNVDKKSFKIDLSNKNLPKSEDEFTQLWHNPPISQGITGTCWSFSTTSFFESEIYRLTKKQVKLSEMYTVYCEYLEKASRYVDERGNSEFSEGSQGNAATRIWRKYGCMPENEFTGLLNGQPYHDHSKMAKEMTTYLESVKARNAWNKNEVLSTIKDIMNHYIGTPPEKFTYNGKTYTAQEFLKNEIKIDPSDYVDIMSLMEQGYWKKAEYDVPDNWWNSDTYMNVPVEDFISSIKKAVKSGYSMFIGGDVSESGIVANEDIAMVPSYDIPSEYIDDYARQFRYDNKTTTDDHGVHIVGYKEIDGKTWFLIKDSGSSGHNGKAKGYFFFHEDYVKLKIMSVLIHKAGVAELIQKFNQNAKTPVN